VSRWSRHRIRRLVSVLTIVVSLTALSGISPAGATTNTASLGNVTATLTYQTTYPIAGNIGVPEARNSILTIKRAGHLVYRGAVDSPMCGRLCWPQAAYGSGKSDPLRVVRLQAGSPDVLLGLYSGGAHCCFVDQVFAPSSDGFYSKTEIDLGDPGANLQALPGSPYAQLVTADDSFAYAFTDFAASGLPIKIERLEGHHFVDVTRLHPALIRKDASQWLAAFYAQKSSKYQDSVGVIAAWTADEYLLGRSAAAITFLHQQALAGHLNSLLNPSLKSTAFVTALERFLTQRGY